MSRREAKAYVPAVRTHRVAAVSFLNTRPLICGLEETEAVALTVAVPAELSGLLARGQADAALLPSIDLQRLDRPPTILPAGCIASAGPTFTVRVFSRAGPESVTTLWADTASHTSVALAQVLWASSYGRRPEIIPFDPLRRPSLAEAEAVLLIGDKVVSAPPAGFDWQIDLGRMWHEQTGLPFVFAVWAAAEGADCEALHAILLAARARGRGRLEQIARQFGPLHGWPVELARRYLTEILQFAFTPAHRAGLEEFFRRAADCGVIDEIRALHYYEP